MITQSVITNEASVAVALDLPTDRPRLATENEQRATHSFAISSSVTTAITELAGTLATSSQTILATVLTALLHRYSGQNQIVIGMLPVDIADRQPTLLTAAITQLRADFTAEQTFRDLFASIQSVTVDHADTSVYQVMSIAYASAKDYQSQGVLRSEGLKTKIQQCDMVFATVSNDGEYAGTITYNPALFDVATIARMADHWQSLLWAAASDPDQLIATAPILTSAEVELFDAWNTTALRIPQMLCLQHMVEQQIERTPDAPAIIMNNEQLTYRELNVRANQLAHRLRQSGVVPETLVGIYVERSLDMVVGILGILKAGGAYVPLDPTYPADRIAYIQHEANLEVMVTQQRFASAIPGNAQHIICLDDSTLGDEISDNTLVNMSQNTLAYVLFTSGSTGKPKGVQVTHRAMVNFLTSMQREPGLTASDKVLAVTTLSFDIAGLELLFPLTVGAEIVIASHDMVADGAALVAAIEKYAITFMQATPVTWRLLLAAGWQGTATLTVITGGEALPKELAEQLVPRCQALWNLYGPTETTVYSTAYHVATTDDDIFIGRPIANTQLYILDSHQQMVPIGIPGELYIGGAGVARGYINRPDLTDDRFVTNPFIDEPHQRIYRTGDLVKYRPDGNIEYLGRLDHQVKIRGFRIELGEVESVLRQHASVAEAVVVAREDVPGQKRLVAYVILQEGCTIAVTALRDHVQAALPAYMIPAAFVLLQEFPITPNGKIDRKALPAPDVTPNLYEEHYRPPTTDVQRDLALIWEELLHITPVGIDDNFFNLGGDSLLAAQLIATIEERFGVVIPVTTLFAQPTVAQLGAAITEQEEQQEWVPVLEVQHGDGKRLPFFYLHGDWSGGAFYCYSLARQLGKEQQFYALAPHRLVPDEVPPTIEDMAAECLKLLLSVQPTGPYQIGGFCNGAIVAYEVAQQLLERGHEVQLLFLVDSMAPASQHWLYTPLNYMSSALRLSHQQELDIFLRVRHFCKFLQPPSRQRTEDFTYLQNLDERLLSPVPASAPLRKDLVGLFTWVSSHYRPRPFKGKVTMVWDSEAVAQQQFWQHGEMQLADQVEVVEIPGTHITSRTEHLHVLARLLKERLSGHSYQKVPIQ